MNNDVDPDFFKAFDHYKTMLEQYGYTFPITEYAFLFMLYYTPEYFKAEMDAQAKEPNVLPTANGYLDNGEPIYSLQGIAKHLGMSIKNAERHLARMMKTGKRSDYRLTVVLTDAHMNNIQ